MKYLFSLLVIILGNTGLRAQTSYVFNPVFQNMDTVACLSDSNITVLRPEGWKIYLTTNDEWNGPIDSSICVEMYNDHTVKLGGMDASRHLFITADSTFNHILLPKNSAYELSINFYVWNAQVNEFGNCGMVPCSYIAANIQVPDSIGFSIDHRFQPAALDTIHDWCGYGVCMASEKFDSQYVDNLVAALSFFDIDSTSVLYLNNFDLSDYSNCGGGLIQTDTFTSITAFPSGSEYDYYFNNWGVNLGLYSDSTYPSPNHISYIDVYPDSNQQTTQQTINLYTQFESKLMLQPFTQLRGGPVNGQPGLFHNLNLFLDGGTFCLPFIDVIIRQNDKFIYSDGEIEFHAPMSCLLFHNDATFQITDNATLDYGPTNHEGVLALYEDAKIEIGNNATMNIYNTVHIREQNPLNGPKQFYMTLNPGSTLRFMPGSHLANMDCADGSMKMNVHMKGGVLDDSGLSAEEKLLINRIYDVNSPGQFELWPNPSSETLHVNLDNSRYDTIYITDVCGRLLYMDVVESALMDINVSDFANGVYVIQAFSENSSAVQSWVKQ